MNTQPDLAARAAERIHGTIRSYLAAAGERDAQYWTEKFAAIIRPYLADAEARAQAAEAKLAEVERWCCDHQGWPGLRWAMNELLDILNREQP